MSYRNLQIWQIARELTSEIHHMSFRELPKHEAYGRRRDKQDFIRFLTFAHASCDETIDHLEILRETGSLNDEALFEKLHSRLNQLGGKLNRFITSVEAQHNDLLSEDPSIYNE